MKNPPHPGEHLRRDYLESLGLSVTAAARTLGVTRQTPSNLVNGAAAARRKWRSACPKPSAAAPEAWFGMQTNYDLAQGMRKADAIKVERVVGSPKAP
jgi:antitoxin HigA-1